MVLGLVGEKAFNLSLADCYVRDGITGERTVPFTEMCLIVLLPHAFSCPTSQQIETSP